MPIEPGQHAMLLRTVTEQDTAQALGSGDLPVLATPRLLAWCEQATVAAVAGSLTARQSSVGTRVELAHERASAVGSEVTVRAAVAHVDGRLLRFDVVAEQVTADGASQVLGRATVTRVVVNRDRFLGRL